jgi:cell division ATPase FtsA
MAKETKNLVVALDIGTSKVVALVAELLEQPDRSLNRAASALDTLINVMSRVVDLFG